MEHNLSDYSGLKVITYTSGPATTVDHISR